MRADRIRRIRDYQIQNNRDYEPQDRYRDSRGREHYNNGRYATRNEYRDEYTDYYDDRRRIGFSYEPRMGESYGGEHRRDIGERKMRLDALDLLGRGFAFYI